jgi:phage-related protein (TIGR01555 family)
LIEVGSSTADEMKAAQSLTSPLPAKVKSIKKFNVLSDPIDFQLVSENTGNLKSTKYNVPIYEIQGERVDPSRIIAFVNSFRSRDLEGISVVDRVRTGLEAQSAALFGSTTILERLGAILYKSTNVTLEKNSKQLVTALLAAIKSRLKSTGILGLRPNDEATLLTYSFSGIKDVFEFVLDNLAALSGVPKTILLGSSPGGIVSGDGTNAVLMQYYQRLESMQETELTKADRYLIDLFSITEDSQLYQITKGDKLPYVIKYNPVWGISEKEQAEIRKMNAESDKIDFETGKAGGMELRALDERYDDSEDMELTEGGEE